jgi:PAS domain S-box-containing protein
MSFRVKTIFAIAFIGTVVLAIMAWRGFTILREFSEREWRNHANTSATLFAKAAKDAFISRDPVRLEKLIAETLQIPGLIYIRVLDVNNQTVAEGQTSLGPQPSPQIRYGENTVFQTTATIVDNGIRLGQVHLGSSTAHLQRPLASARYEILFAAAVALLPILLLSWFLGDYLLRRFNRFTEALQSIAIGKFGFQLPWRGKDELAQMAATFNQMSSRVEQFFTEVIKEENRKSAILDAALDCVITVDQQGLINEFNTAAETTFGYARQQILGKPAKSLIALIHRTGFTKSITHYLLTGKDPLIGKRTEIRALRADDTEFPAELTISAIHLGEQILFTLYLRDITERKQVESERQRLMMAVEASPDSIFITDPQGLIRYVNPAFTSITGWTAAEIIGKPPGVLKSEQMATGFYADMWTNLRQGKIWSGRILKRRKQSQQPAGRDFFWAQSTIAPIQSSTGELQGYVAVERDITEAVQREEHEFYERESAEIRARVSQILQSQQPLQERFQQALQCVLQISGLNLHHKGCILIGRQDNPTLEVFVTYGKIDAESITQLQCLALNASPPENCQTVDEIVVANDSLPGSNMGYYAVPMRHGDKVLGFLLLLTESNPSRDSTRLAMLRLIGEMMGLALANHSVQQEMEKARLAAEDATRTKSQFLANMSHEIRTPMYGVIGMLDLLRQQNLTTSQREYLDTANNSARLLLSLIDDILDFSRIEAGELHLEHIDFNVGQALEDVCSLLAERAHQKKLELTCFVADEVPQSVRGDPTRLQQVLTNLVGNAIKFTEQGEVAVSVRVEGEQPEQICLRFLVRDTGIGIAPEAQARLFRPFSQADGSTSRRYGGTGLGLVISKQLVELMDGAIGFESIPGQGSTFWFTARFTNPMLGVPFHSEITGIRILIVDDNATTRNLLENYLGRWGIIHDSAANGLEALEKLRQMTIRGHSYQVVILDWQMPGMDGLELAQAIRADRSLKDVRLLLLSSLIHTSDRLRASESKFCLTKPVRQSNLYEALVRVMSDETTEAIPIDTPLPHRLPQLQGRVLLVEDNEINQTVGLQMLRQLGLVTKLASDGLEAIKAFERCHYDAILMDCQMPRVDGFEVTRAIREREKRLNKTPTPIIALTANAMKGDREICLAAGMDDYLAKPFELAVLAKLLSNWLPAKPIDTDGKVIDNVVDELESLAPAQPVINASPPGLDQKKLSEIRNLLGSNFHKLVEAFEKTGNALVVEMEKAVAAGDIKMLISRAHHLKGSSGNIGATDLYELCQSLQESAPQDPAENLSSQVKKIATAHVQACKQLRSSA